MNEEKPLTTTSQEPVAPPSVATLPPEGSLPVSEAPAAAVPSTVPEASSLPPVNAKKPSVLPWFVVGVLALIGIVLLLVFFLVPGKQQEVVMPNPTVQVTPILSPTPALDVGAPLSPSDEVSDLQQDLNSSDLSALDQELPSIDSQLSTP